MYTLGAIPSPHDSRDYPLALLTPVKTEHAETFEILYPGTIKNQGMIGSCVAHSLSYIKEMIEFKQSGEYKPFSVGFIYGNRKPDDHQFEGMIPREALANLVSSGDVLYDDFPWNDEYDTCKRQITNHPELLPKAEPFRITTYARLNTVDDIKTALEDVGPVTFCINVYESLYSCTGIVALPTDADKWQGQHEMTIIGWNKDGFLVLNSWGEEWGDKGRCILPYDYPIVEAWSATDSIVANVSGFVANVLPGAIECYRTYGILPSVTLAQACLESGWGDHAPGNNMFGIKWREGCGYDKQLLWTWEYLNSAWVRVQAYFRKYDSLHDSIIDHAKLLTAKRYIPVRQATDYKVACQALQTCGYATSPNYAKSLISMIEKYNLNKWDREGYKMYNDFDKVSDWAKDYVEKAQKLGLMAGDDAGNFNPKGNVTREQLAKVICELYDKRNA